MNKAFISLFFIAIFVCLNAGLSLAQTEVTECDHLASHPQDSGRVADGIKFEKINAELALVACQKAVEKYPNSLRSIYQLGRSYDANGAWQESFKYYHEAAEAGYLAATYSVALSYKDGTGVKKDMGLLRHWIENGAQRGYILSKYDLAYIMLDEGKQKQALELLLLVAGDDTLDDQMKKYAYETLGALYLGRGQIEKDYKKSEKYLLLAAEEGLAKASTIYAAGIHKGYFQGRDGCWQMCWLAASFMQEPEFMRSKLSNVTEDWLAPMPENEKSEMFKEAAEVFGLDHQSPDNDNIVRFRRFMDKGYGEAGYILFVKYEHYDSKTSVELLKWASNHLSPKSQVELGWLYVKGRGVEKDLVEAYKWFEIANLLKYDKGYKASKYLIGRLSEAEHKEAYERVKEWQKSWKSLFTMPIPDTPIISPQ